jgi:hypothetical protein
MAKRIALAFLWLFSILSTADITAYVMNSPAWVWDTKPWVRRIKHWPEPVVALAGDMPIYQSDLQDIFDDLSPQLQDSERKMKASEALVNMTVTPLLWRIAAQSTGVLQSSSTYKLLENYKNNILKTLINKQLYTRQADPTEDQIQTFIDQNPSLFAKRVIHYRLDQYYAPLPGKSQRQTLVSSRHASFVYPGKFDPPDLSLLLPLSPGQSTSRYPCGPHHFCQYTKEGKDGVIPAFDMRRAEEIAKIQLKSKTETDWLSPYQKTHPIKIKRQDLINNILR